MKRLDDVQITLDGSVRLSQLQLSELAKIGREHLYQAAGKLYISQGGIIVILRKYEEFRSVKEENGGNVNFAVEWSADDIDKEIDDLMPDSNE